MSEPPPPNSPSPLRPWRLLDLMGLVAAVAFTLVSPSLMKAIIPAKSHDSWDRRQFVLHLAAMILAWWTATLLVLALYDPREQFRERCRTPGIAAVVAVAAALVFLGLRQVVTALVMTGHQLASGIKPDGGILSFGWLFGILERAPDSAGSAIVAAWLVLGITRAGRSDSSRIGRLGRVLAWAWLLVALLSFLVWRLPIPWLTRSGIGD